MITKDQIEIIKKILEPYSPEEIGIFGSYARGENSEESDLDILISLKKRITLFDFVGLEQELSEQLGVKVDLVTKRSISPLIQEFVERDLKMIA